MTDALVLKSEINELNREIAEQLEALRKQRLRLRDLRHIRDLKMDLLRKLGEPETSTRARALSLLGQAQ